MYIYKGNKQKAAWGAKEPATMFKRNQWSGDSFTTLAEIIFHKYVLYDPNTRPSHDSHNRFI